LQVKGATESGCTFGRGGFGPPFPLRTQKTLQKQFSFLQITFSQTSIYMDAQKRQPGKAGRAKENTRTQKTLQKQFNLSQIRFPIVF